MEGSGQGTRRQVAALDRISQRKRGAMACCTKLPISTRFGPFGPPRIVIAGPISSHRTIQVECTTSVMNYALATLGLALLLIRGGAYGRPAQTSGVSAPAAAAAERLMTLTRDTEWTPVASVAVRFTTHHPQGMVKIGDNFYVSSVQVKVAPKRFSQVTGGFDRDAGAGTGHLFKIDKAGNLLADLPLGEGTIYHPGGIDYDGVKIWVPVAEYRPNSRAVVYRVNPQRMEATAVFRFADHIGAIVHNTDDHTLHGVSWGSRRFYRWPLEKSGRITNAEASPRQLATLNTSHYLDYQDCKYAGRNRMLCTGVTEFRTATPGAPFRLGGVDLIDLRDGRPLHQVPVTLWTDTGLDMTHNPTWFEPTAAGLRAYFMPEDDRSTIYVYEAK
jgi:hypothetical protein